MARPLPHAIVLGDPDRVLSALYAFRSGAYIYHRGPDLSIGLETNADRSVLVRVFIYAPPVERTEATAQILF